VVALEGIDGLYADLRAGHMPAFSFISPTSATTCTACQRRVFCATDANTIQMGDAMVKKLVGAIRGSETWKEGNNVIIVMWDENDFTDTPNLVGMIVDTSYDPTRQERGALQPPLPAQDPGDRLRCRLPEPRLRRRCTGDD